MISRVLQDLVRYEGLRLKPYRCTSNKLTIGYGRNLDDNGISIQEANLLLFSDVFRVIESLMAKLDTFSSQPAAVQTILIEMGYQLGIGGLLEFRRFLSALNVKDYKVARDELTSSKWAKQTPVRAMAMSAYLLDVSETSNEASYHYEYKVCKEIINNLSIFNKIEKIFN